MMEAMLPAWSQPALAAAAGLLALALVWAVALRARRAAARLPPGPTFTLPVLGDSVWLMILGPMRYFHSM